MFETLRKTLLVTGIAPAALRRWISAPLESVCPACRQPAARLPAYPRASLSQTRMDFEGQRAGVRRDATPTLEDLVDQCPAGLALLDASGRYLHVNPSLASVNGVAADAHVGLGFSDLFPPVEAELLTHLHSEVVRTGAPLVNLEHRAIPPGEDAPHDWLGTYYPILRDGQVVAVGALVLDVTERKRTLDEMAAITRQLEQRIHERTSALVAANRELESFSYTASHDLRAPLRGISFFARVLEEENGAQLDATGREFLRRIQHESARLTRLVDDLLALSRVGTGDLKRREVDVTAMACEIAAILHAREPERRVSFLIAEGLRVDGDERLLHDAIENLLSNAWKYTRSRPDARVEVGAEPDGTLYVRDNGVGFDPAQVGRLFRPFQRLHPKEEYEGTGIGLATVKRIIERHGGRVWAEGEPGVGATFRFSIPARAAMPGRAVPLVAKE